MATTHPHPGIPTFSRSRDERSTHDVPPSFPPADVDDDADGWKTSTAPNVPVPSTESGATRVTGCTAMGLRTTVSPDAQLMAPVANGPSVCPTPNVMVMMPMTLGQASGG